MLQSHGQQTEAEPAKIAGPGRQLLETHRDKLVKPSVPVATATWQPHATTCSQKEPRPRATSCMRGGAHVSTDPLKRVSPH